MWGAGPGAAGHARGRHRIRGALRRREGPGRGGGAGAGARRGQGSAAWDAAAVPGSLEVALGAGPEQRRQGGGGRLASPRNEALDAEHSSPIRYNRFVPTILYVHRVKAWRRGCYRYWQDAR